MKALFYSYPWAMDTPGGGERQLQAYQHHLHSCGMQADLFDMWRPNFADYQIFHVFSVMPTLVEICDYLKRRGLKIVVNPNLWITHETKGDYPFSGIWNILELADRVIVNSNMEGDALSDVFAMPRTKFHTVYNGAEAEFLIPADPAVFRKRFDIEGPYVLNVANVERRKNQLEFVRILREERPDLKLIIAGGSRDPQYAQECLQAGGDQVQIIGYLPYASELMRSAMSGCEFFAMPSLLETPSIAAIEAAAIGAKVLLTEVGSTREYFGDSVNYVNPKAPESIRAGIAAMATATTEKSIWAARHRLLWPQIAPEIVNCYNQLF